MMSGVLRRVRRTLLQAARARSVRSALVVLLVVWMGGVAASDRAQSTFESEAVISFSPRDPVATGAETMVLVMPKWVEVIRSPAVVDRAARQVDLPTASVRVSSEAVVQPNTLNLVVRASNADAETASRLAQVLAAGVIDIAAADPLVRAEMVAPAIRSDSPSAPTPAQVRLLALALGLLAAGVTFIGVGRRGASWERALALLRPEPSGGAT